MSEFTHTSAGHSIADLRALAERDLEASNELQVRIERLRKDIADGKKLPKKKIDLMEVSNKDMTKELVTRIEQIEANTTTATDREMLQALNARLTVCDIQAMRLAELRELEREARGDKHEYLEEEDRGQKHTPTAVLTEAAPHHDEANLQKEGPTAVEQYDEEIHVSGLHNTQNYLSDEDVDSHESDDDTRSLPDMSNWATPYRILGIDPKTPSEEIHAQIKM